MNIERALDLIIANRLVSESVVDRSGVNDDSVGVDLKRMGWLNFGPEVRSIPYDKRKIKRTLLKGLKSIFSMVKHPNLTPERYSFYLTVQDYEDGPAFRFEINESVDTIYEAKIPFTETMNEDGALEVDLSEKDVITALKGFLISRMK